MWILDLPTLCLSVLNILLGSLKLLFHVTIRRPDARKML